MDSERILLAQEFKKILSDTIEEVVPKLKLKEETLPIPVSFIDLGVTLFNTQGCPEKIIESFVEGCFPEEEIKDPDGNVINIWSQIGEKNEKVLISIGKKMFEQHFPMLAVQGTKISSFVLTNRIELLGDELEAKLWERSETLIQKAIRYTHVRRHPQINPETGMMQYTKRFAPKMSVKKEAEKWDVKL